MSKETKKMAVLHALRQQNAPVSLSELMRQLGDEFAERSVRRWLSEMVEDNLVDKIGQKRSTHYRAITKPSFSSASDEIIERVKQPLFSRSPTSYHYSWIDEYEPNKTKYIADNVLSELHRAGKINDEPQPAGTFAYQIYNRLLIDISYNSSRLEGNTYSLLETQQLIIEGKRAQDKLDEEAIMILNHKEAIRYLIDNANRIKVDTDTIFTLHFLLSDGLVPSQFSGKVRDYGVRISGSVCIPLENPKLLLEQLHVISEKARLINDPFEASFFLLVHLAYLQAFVDVNKRTSRLSANIPLIQTNLIPLSFNDIQKEDYITAMIAVYEFNRTEPLVDLYVQSYLKTCELYSTTFDALGCDQVRVRYRQERRTIIRDIIVNKLYGNEMDEYVVNQAKSIVKKDELEQFIQDIYEDINDITPARIVGMGISKQQLLAWKRKK